MTCLFPKVGVIILNYNSFEDTEIYVERLNQQQEINLKILVVDNSSPNNSFDYLKDSLSEINNVEVIKTEANKGYAYGNNWGLKYWKNKNLDYIIISNNDIELENSFLVSQMVERYKQCQSPAFVAPIMMMPDGIAEFPAWKIPSIWDDLKSGLFILRKLTSSKIKYELSKHNGDLAVECLPGSFYMAEKNVYFDLGLFDEGTFLYCEERIMAKKVIQNNMCNYLLTDLEFYHAHGKTISEHFNYSNKNRFLLKSRVYFHKNYGNVNSILLSLLWVFHFFNVIEYRVLNFLRK